MIKLDLYTKSILTLIAAALICLCVQNALSPRVVAAQTAQKVILDGVSQGVCGFPRHASYQALILPAVNLRKMIGQEGNILRALP